MRPRQRRLDVGTHHGLNSSIQRKEWTSLDINKERRDWIYKYETKTRVMVVGFKRLASSSQRLDVNYISQFGSGAPFNLPAMASVPKSSSLASIREIDRLSSSPSLKKQSLLSSTRPASIPATPKPYGSPTPPTADLAGTANPPNLMDLLQRSEQSIVKTRTGSVLSRGFILKTDHYPSGMSPRRPLVSLAHASC